MPPGAPSAREVFERIAALEARRDLLQHTLDGWSVWPLFRVPLAHALSGISFARAGGGGTGRLQRLLATAREAAVWARPRRARLLVKTYTSGLLDEVDGRYKDVWFDDLIARLGSSFKVEGLNNRNFLSRRGRALFPSDTTTLFMERAFSLLLRSGRGPDLSRLARSLCSAISAELPDNLLPVASVELHLKHFYWSKRLWGGLLSRVRPSCVLTADPGEHALVAAAREAAIPVVELQHGISDRWHPGYSWTGYAVPYRSRMPIPDRTFLYGEHWRRELDAHGFWGDALRVVGSPRMDHYRSRIAPDRDGGPPTLLVTTQGIEVRETAGFLARVLEVARAEGVEIRLVVKLHPVNEPDRAPYAERFGSDPRATILLGNEGPSTFDLLTRADFHLSISSATHYDALGLGVRTIILGLRRHDVVRHLYDAGHASLARTPEAVVELVQRPGGRGVPPEASGYYFSRGALDNMQRELDRLVSSGE